MMEKTIYVPCGKPSSTEIRRAAVRRYEQQKREKEALRLMENVGIDQPLQPREEKPRDTMLRNKLQIMSKLRKLEQMAVSTRKKKPLTPDDVLDPESVSGMKCQLDLDRQSFAKQRALRLLNGDMF